MIPIAPQAVRSNFDWAKPVIFFLCLTPFLLLLFDTLQGRLGVNPVETLTHRTGDWTLRFLLITLAVTPLRVLLRYQRLQKYRRMLGLFAFFYACLHLTVYLWIDQSFWWGEIAADILKRPYITVGFAAFLILLPLALTSTRAMMRRLGRRWGVLHQGIYIAALLGCLHFLWLTRADYREPLLYLGIFLLLMLVRSLLNFFQRRAGQLAAKASK